MKLNNEQLNQIKELNNVVNGSRDMVLQTVCEILGENWYMRRWSGKANSWVLVDESTIGTSNELVAFVETYRFKSPTSYAVKMIYFRQAKENDEPQYTTYLFDWYGNQVDEIKNRY